MWRNQDATFFCSFFPTEHIFFCFQTLIRHIQMLTHLNCYFNMSFVRPSVRLVINRLRLDSSPPQFLNDIFCAKFDFFTKSSLELQVWNFRVVLNIQKKQIQGGYIIVILSYWTGGGFKQAASWFLPPLVFLGLKWDFWNVKRSLKPHLTEFVNSNQIRNSPRSLQVALINY